MRNIALIIQYQGTDYAGWQSQTNAAAIQDVLEDALMKILGHKVSLCGSGRTDAGVHAAAQVANFFTDNQISTYKLPLGMNIILPQGISVVSAQEVPDSFNARGSAKSKTYVYRFYVSPARLPLLDTTHAQIYKMPDISAMRVASEFFVGKKDFKNFSSTGSNIRSTVREIFKCGVSLSLTAFETNLLYSSGSPESGENENERAVKTNVITIEVCGSAFLYNMVRIIAGTLLAVGKGLLLPADVESIFYNGRPKCIKTAPAKGLTLEKVDYLLNKSNYNTT